MLPVSTNDSDTDSLETIPFTTDSDSESLDLTTLYENEMKDDILVIIPYHGEERERSTIGDEDINEMEERMLSCI